MFNIKTKEDAIKYLIETASKENIDITEVPYYYTYIVMFKIEETCFQKKVGDIVMTSLDAKYVYTEDREESVDILKDTTRKLDLVDKAIRFNLSWFIGNNTTYDELEEYLNKIA